MYNIKKVSSIYFLFTIWKKNSIREKKKNWKRKKHKIVNILEGKKIKGKKSVAGVLGVTLLCVIHGATVENIFFKDGDDANIFRAFNPTQTFLYLKKNIDLLQSAGHYASYYIIM